MQNLSIPADAPARGMWSAPAAWPMVGLHQAVLPDGKVLTWGTTPDGNTQNGRYFDLWDPNRGLLDAGAHNLSYDATRQDSFCAPSVYTGDGRLMITGGTGSGNNGTTSQYYTPSTSAFAQGPSVADARWYAATKGCRYLVTSVTNKAPTVSLTAPTNNASVAQGTAVTLSASAADADGTVAKVEFFDGSTLLANDTTSPYSYAWTNAAPGTHTLTARATDNSGAATTSAAITLTVTVPATPPASATTCASENGTCTIPAGTTATVWYGAGTKWAVKTGVSGSIACTNAVFGDPFVGTAKACKRL